jgi:UDP-N-acetylmuramyl pentapeptide phosphotransferase/UDP-N-acetylglucosamine-1-phosphate transferase
MNAEPLGGRAASAGRMRLRWPDRIRVVLRVVMTTTSLVALYFLIPLNPHSSVAVALLVLMVVGLGGLIAWQAHAIVRSPRPQLRAIEALAATIPLLLTGFAACYVVMSETTPSTFTEALTRVDALYFSVTVFATVGFGDIAAVSSAGRGVVTAQMVVDLLVLGVGLRVITGAVQQSRERRAVPPSDVEP